MIKPPSPKAADIARISWLRREIQRHNDAYYGADSPIILDSAYDALLRELQDLEARYPTLASKDSPSARVASASASSFGVAMHHPPMLSLEKAYTAIEVASFYDKIRRFLGIDSATPIAMVVMEKIDGLSLSLRYVDGHLALAATRGDGIQGEDITQNARMIANIPKTIAHAPHVLEVRGEVYMPNDDFLLLNDNQRLHNLKTFATPRHAAAGSLRQLDATITRSRNLYFWAFGIGSCSESLGDTFDAVLHSLSVFGFPVNPHIAVCPTLDDVLSIYNTAVLQRASRPYAFDGMVYMVNDLVLQQRLGSLAHAPRYAIAHKFEADKGYTILEGIILQVGRSGVITPVAQLSPIDIGGVVITRASLHNADEIARKDIRIGDWVLVARAGDVIPQVDSVDMMRRSPSALPFVFPSVCPSCDHALSRSFSAVAFHCFNPACPAQRLERLVYAVSRSAFDIDGLGEQQLRLFLERGLIHDLADIFLLARHRDTLMMLDGFGIVSVDKLLSAIAHAATVPLARFILALSIHQVGEMLSKLLARHYLTWETFFSSMLAIAAGDSSAREQLLSLHGVGDSIANDLAHFFSQQSSLAPLYHLVPLLTITPERVAAADIGILSGKILVFTGALQRMGRLEAKALAERHGAIIASSVSSKTSFVIAGADSGSKLSKAENLGIPILTEDDFFSMLDEKILDNN